ncbi:MAG: hypothetical protein H8E48_02980 [Chloroflexi bacterium]|nr:hypothetical protein [Chloroflexota bacterium]
MEAILRIQRDFMDWIQKYVRVFSILGAAAFFIGYTLAVIAGIWWPENGDLIATLVILGLVVGVLNVTSREVTPYLVAAIALVLIGSTQVFTPLNLVSDGLGERVNLIVRMMAIFTAPAAVLQAIRAGMLLARPGESTSH